MKYHLLALTTLFAFAFSAIGADSTDLMLKKLLGTNTKPPTAPPYALTSYALVGKDNTIAVSAWTGSLVFEGSVWNNITTKFAFANPTANRTVTFADATGTTFLSTLATNAPDAANGVWGISNGLRFEGATANAYETDLVPTDPTADRIITLPDAAGTVSLVSTAAITPASTISYTPGGSVTCSTLTPAQSETINAVTTGAISGKVYYFVITTSGVSSYTLTFGTNFKTTGTLATGTTSGKVFVISFIFDGTNFNEVARTTAM